MKIIPVDNLILRELTSTYCLLQCSQVRSLCPVWYFICLDKLDAHLNARPQTEHRWGFPVIFLSSPVCFFLCLLRFELSAKDMSHWSHWWGFLSKWIFRCLFSMRASGKPLEHTGQTWSRSFGWLIMCTLKNCFWAVLICNKSGATFKSTFKENDSSHFVHGYFNLLEASGFAFSSVSYCVSFVVLFSSVSISKISFFTCNL